MTTEDKATVDRYRETAAAHLASIDALIDEFEAKLQRLRALRTDVSVNLHIARARALVDAALKEPPNGNDDFETIHYTTGLDLGAGRSGG